MIGREAGLVGPLGVCVSVYVRVFASRRLETVTWSQKLAGDWPR